MGGVAPRQKNRIRHHGEQGGNESKEEEGDTRNERKTTKIEKEGENGERQEGKGETKKKREEEKGKCVPATFFYLFIFTFQLLDKVWSKVWSFLSPSTCLQLLSRIGLSIVTAR